MYCTGMIVVVGFLLSYVVLTCPSNSCVGTACYGLHSLVCLLFHRLLHFAEMQQQQRPHLSNTSLAIQKNKKKKEQEIKKKKNVECRTSTKQQEKLTKFRVKRIFFFCGYFKLIFRFKYFMLLLQLLTVFLFSLSVCVCIYVCGNYCSCCCSCCCFIIYFLLTSIIQWSCQSGKLVKQFLHTLPLPLPLPLSLFLSLTLSHTHIQSYTYRDLYAFKHVSKNSFFLFLNEEITKEVPKFFLVFFFLPKIIKQKTTQKYTYIETHGHKERSYIVREI